MDYDASEIEEERGRIPSVRDSLRYIYMRVKNNKRTSHDAVSHHKHIYTARER